MHADELELHLVEPPFRGFHRTAIDNLVVLVVVALHPAPVDIVEPHFVVVLRERIGASQAKLQAALLVGALDDAIELVGVERAYLIREVEVEGRVLLGHHVDGTTQRRTAKAIGHQTLIDLDALNHVGGHVVESHEIAKLRHRSLVDIHTDALTLQATNGDARGAAQSACVSDGDTHGARQHVVQVVGSALQLPFANHGYRHGRLTKHSEFAASRHLHLVQLDRVFIS